jgi:lipopolysaccharide transport system permease protein
MQIASNKLWFIWLIASRLYGQRYKGSLLGYLWPFLAMAVMLFIYSMVFSVIFKARWQQVGVEVAATDIPFWLILLAGQMIYQLFSETMNQAPSLILAVPNYVKKVKFPLAILPVANYICSLFNVLIGLMILIAASICLGVHHWSIMLTPLVLLQTAFWCLGLSWFLSALGIFFRDLQQMTGLLSLALLFATPIFYPPDIVPPEYKIFLDINPLAYIIGTLRGLLFWGETPAWPLFCLWTLASAAFAAAGYYIFQKLRPNFADIL